MSEETVARKSVSNKRIYDFLQENQVGVLATVDPNGSPHAVAIYVSVDENFVVTFMTKNETKKHDDLKRNPKAMLAVVEPASQSAVQIAGIAEEVTDDEAAQKIFDSMLRTAYKASEEGEPPISKLYAGHYAAWRLRPAQVRMAVFARPVHGGYDMFETIDFKP